MARIATNAFYLFAELGTGLASSALFHSPETACAADRLPQVSVFLPHQANEARRLAQEQCKPLVVHVVPNSSVGVKQVGEFYGRFGAIPKDVLDKVVIVVLPGDRYGRFASQLGITDAGGLRTISAYDLDALDARSVTTCRAGFI